MAKKQSNKPVIVDIDQLTGEDRKGIVNLINSVVKTMEDIKNEQDAIKDLVKNTSERYGVDKKMVNKLIKTKYKDSLSADISEFDKLQATYELLFGDTA